MKRYLRPVLPPVHVGLLVLALVAGPLPAAADVALTGPFSHLEALQKIADANGGNRAAGTAGYDRSADYVAERLRQAGYDVRFEEFSFPFFEERTPPVLLTGLAAAPSPRREVRTLSRSGSGDVTAPLVAVDLGAIDAAPSASTSGCEAADFAGFPHGAIALMRRGTCTFQVKVEMAAAAGAAGAIIMNEGTADRTAIFGGQVNGSSIPVVGVTFDLGRTLANAAQAAPSTPARLAVDAVSGTRATRNVVANWPSTASGEVIIVGAHLDSVHDGPGINDNGSGSAAVLETALRLAASTPQQLGAVQFGFWGAEEVGLLGSRHHVGALSDAQKKAIRLYVNLDMVASPNHARFVQTTQGAPGSVGAMASEVLSAYFQNRGIAVDVRSRNGNRGFSTDDSSFAQAGIPTVGLYTGAGEAKPAELAARFGGRAGQAFDACYHQACDTLANIDRAVLDQMTDALAASLLTLAGAPGPEGEPRL